MVSVRANLIWKGTGDEEGRRTEEVKEGGEGSKRKKVGKGEEPDAGAQGWEGTKLGREAAEKREFRAQRPAAGKRRASERRRRRDPAPRRPGGPRARRAPGGAQKFPRGRDGPGVGASPPAAAARHLPRLWRRGRAVAAPAAATEGAAARTSAPPPRP